MPERLGVQPLADSRGRAEGPPPPNRLHGPLCRIGLPPGDQAGRMPFLTSVRRSKRSRSCYPGMRLLGLVSSGRLGGAAGSAIAHISWGGRLCGADRPRRRLRPSDHSADNQTGVGAKAFPPIRQGVGWPQSQGVLAPAHRLELSRSTLTLAARPGRRSFDLAGPSSNDLSAGAGARQLRARRGDRERDRPRDNHRGARADGIDRAETASPLRTLRRSLALPLSRGTREGDARRCRAACREPTISPEPE
jgi:hypothetical protein